MLLKQEFEKSKVDLKLNNLIYKQMYKHTQTQNCYILIAGHSSKERCGCARVFNKNKKKEYAASLITFSLFAGSWMFPLPMLTMYELNFAVSCSISRNLSRNSTVYRIFSYSLPGLDTTVYVYICIGCSWVFLMSYILSFVLCFEECILITIAK